MQDPTEDTLKDPELCEEYEGERRKSTSDKSVFGYKISVTQIDQIATQKMNV